MSKSDRIAAWMRRQMTAAGARGFIVGLSGGVDSAVVARLSQLAAPGNVIAAILPCHSDPQDEYDAALVARHFSLATLRVDLTPTYEALAGDVQAARNALPPQPRAAAPSAALRRPAPGHRAAGAAGRGYGRTALSPARASAGARSGRDKGMTPLHHARRI